MAAGVSWDFADRWAADATVEYLGRVGSDFTNGAEDRMGRSRQASAWLGVTRRF